MRAASTNGVAPFIFRLMVFGWLPPAATTKSRTTPSGGRFSSAFAAR